MSFRFSREPLDIEVTGKQKWRRSPMPDLWDVLVPGGCAQIEAALVRTQAAVYVRCQVAMLILATRCLQTRHDSRQKASPCQAGRTSQTCAAACETVGA